MIESVFITDSNYGLAFEYLSSLTSPSFRSVKEIISAQPQGSFNSSTLPKRVDKKEQHINDSIIGIGREYTLCRRNYGNALYVFVVFCEKDALNPVLPFAFIDSLGQVLEEYFEVPVTVAKLDGHLDTLTLLLNEMLSSSGIPYNTDFNRLRDHVSHRSLLSKFLATSNDLANAATSGQLSSLSTPTSVSRMTSGGGSSSSQVISTKSTDISVNSIPWRRSNVKYTNNEMYVDVMETINVIFQVSSRSLDKNNNKTTTKNAVLSNLKAFDLAFYSTSTSGSALRSSSQSLVPITATIDGQIQFLSHLTGVPLLQMVLHSDRLNFSLPAFHRCVEVKEWIRSPGLLRFIPPDGKSTLMKYQVDIIDKWRKDKKNSDLFGLINVGFETGLGPSQNEFEIRLFINGTKGVKNLEELVVDIEYGDNFNRNSEDGRSSSPETESDDEDYGLDKDLNDDGENDTANINCGNGNGNEDIIIKSLRVTHGDFTIEGNNRGHWNLRSVATGTQPIFRGSLITNRVGGGDDFRSISNLPSVIDVDLVDTGNPNSTTTREEKISLEPLFIRLSYSHKGCVPSGTKVDSLKIVSAKGLGDTVKPFKGVKYITTTGNYIVRT